VHTTFSLPRLLAGLSAGVLALTALAGCGSGSTGDTGSATDTGSSSSGAAPSSESGSSSGAADATGTPVTATESDFAIDLSDRELTAGTYTFTVTNAGKATHSLEIEGPGLSDATSDTLQGGQSTTLTVTLQPGEYEVYCPIGNHRAMGMDTTLTVK
jgi:plastocyanin